MLEGLFGGADSKGHEEEDEAEDGVQETHNLPEGMVVAIGVVGVGVGGEIGLEGEHEQEPDGEGDEVLDRETPPELEVVHPSGLLGLVLSGVLAVLDELELGHRSGELAHTGEEHLGVPLLDGGLGGESGNNPHDDLDHPEEDQTNPGVVTHGEEGDNSEDNEGSPVADEQNDDGGLAGASDGILKIVDPTGTEALEETEEEHEVDSEVVIDDVEVGETPVEAEDGGEASTDQADHQGNELSGSSSSPGGVSNDSGGGLDEGEGGVNSEGEQNNGEDEGPEVGSSEGVDSGGIGNEGKTNGGSFFLDGGVNALEVTDNGEHSESSEEGEARVSESDTEGVTNDFLVNGVVRRVGGHDTHADTNGEEDLSAGLRPHASVSELLTNVGALTIDLSEEVHTDTLVGVLKGETTHDHDEDEHDGEGHGNPDDVGGGLDTLEDAEVDEDPGKEGAEEHLPLELGVLEGVTVNVRVGVV